MSSASSRQPANHLHLQQSVQPQAIHSDPANQNGADATDQSSSNAGSTSGRQQPIAPPSEPMQYRAIGLVRGRYVPSDDQFNRGYLQTADGSTLDAVLLGQVMSLVKKHLDLEASHLWVVYPRTREKQAGLHIQIVGVWEPEALQAEDGSTAVGSEGSAAPQADDYFSVRGEVMFQSPDQEYVVVRIQQSPRKTSEEPKSFKLRLEGALPTRAVGYFWDLEAQRQGNQLVIQEGQSIAMVPPKKPAQKSKRPLSAGNRYGARAGQLERPARPGKPHQGSRPPISKPIKRNDSRPTGG